MCHRNWNLKQMANMLLLDFMIALKFTCLKMLNLGYSTLFQSKAWEIFWVWKSMTSLDFCLLVNPSNTLIPLHLATYHWIASILTQESNLGCLLWWTLLLWSNRNLYRTHIKEWNLSTNNKAHKRTHLFLPKTAVTSLAPVNHQHGLTLRICKDHKVPHQSKASKVKKDLLNLAWI